MSCSSGNTSGMSCHVAVVILVVVCHVAVVILVVVCHVM